MYIGQQREMERERESASTIHEFRRRGGEKRERAPLEDGPQSQFELSLDSPLPSLIELCTSCGVPRTLNAGLKTHYPSHLCGTHESLMRSLRSLFAAQREQRGQEGRNGQIKGSNERKPPLSRSLPPSLSLVPSAVGQPHGLRSLL